MSPKPCLFQTLLDAKSSGIDKDTLEKQIWDAFGRTCAVLVMDSTGFSRTTRKKGIVHFLSIIAEMREIGRRIFTENGAFGFRAEADNLVGIYAALAKTDKASVLKEFGGSQFSKFKPALVELAVEKLAPIAAEMKRISDDQSYVDEVLKDGGERANEISSKHLRVIKDIVGFLQS